MVLGDHEYISSSTFAVFDLPLPCSHLSHHWTNLPVLPFSIKLDLVFFLQKMPHFQTIAQMVSILFYSSLPYHVLIVVGTNNNDWLKKIIQNNPRFCQCHGPKHSIQVNSEETKPNCFMDSMYYLVNRKTTRKTIDFMFITRCCFSS